MENDGLPDSQITIRMLTLIGIWLEVFLYGLYLYLFTWVINVLRDKLGGFSAKVFFTGIIAMFVLISLYTGLITYQHGIVAFAYAQNNEQTISYIFNMNRWQNMSLPIVHTLATWVGDVLMIYRCFIIWHRNYYIIALPLLLFAVAMGMQFAIFDFIAQQSDVNKASTQDYPLFRVLGPIYIAQNILTTSLMIYKLWSSDQEAKAIGLVSFRTPNLSSIARILVESAAIYTSLQLVVFTLIVIDHPAAFLVLDAVAPLTGILFVLVTIRAHSLGEDAKSAPTLVPSWLFNLADQSKSKLLEEGSSSTPT